MIDQLKKIAADLNAIEKPTAFQRSARHQCEAAAQNLQWHAEAEKQRAASVPLAAPASAPAPVAKAPGN